MANGNTEINENNENQPTGSVNDQQDNVTTNEQVINENENQGTNQNTKKKTAPASKKRGGIKLDNNETVVLDDGNNKVATDGEKQKKNKTQPKEQKEETNVNNKQPDDKKNETNKKKSGDVKTEKNDDISRVAFFNEKLKTFNKMYKVDIDPDKFVADVSEAWEMLKSEDEQKKAEAGKIMGDLVKDTLKWAFDVEKKVAYSENRIPDFSEITKSANDLLRVSMFAFTDLYHDRKSEALFDQTALGGLKAKDIAELTSEKSDWNMDQRSDEAWKIQSREAINLAETWLKEEKPYEMMIRKMRETVEADKKGTIDRKEVFKRLAAAEWMLINNEKMMVEDPTDPLNPIPNWGNRYWKALCETREALGIMKHISMRELIQGNYAEAAKSTVSTEYTTKQIEENVLSGDARKRNDSIDLQKEQFAIESSSARFTSMQSKRDPKDFVMTSERMQITVEQVNEYRLMKEAPKASNFIVAAKETTLEFSAKK